jgi:sugar phosphate isomerase/epimerase
MSNDTMSRRALLGSAAVAACVTALSKAAVYPKEWKPRLGIVARYTEANVDFAIQESFNNMILFAGAGAPGLDAVKLTDEQAQVDEIVRVYNEKYFAACEKYNVRILWEPWQGGPNIATSPVGFEALLKAFKDSPYVGLQYDPSHLVWQMMDPIQAARDFADKIYDIHLKDTQIHWDIVRRGGIVPVNQARWWHFRIPGMGSIDWPEFFSVFQSVGYQGAMSIEHEDILYGAEDNPGPDFSEPYKVGFRMAKRYLNQYVPA